MPRPRATWFLIYTLILLLAAPQPQLRAKVCFSAPYAKEISAEKKTFDGNGNVVGLISAATGAATAEYDYAPFGELIRPSGTSPGSNPFRFSTKYEDEESSLLYYGYRYYNPSTGKWLSRDPIGERGGKNLTRFNANQPISTIDPDGKAPQILTLRGSINVNGTFNTPVAYYGGDFPSVDPRSREIFSKNEVQAGVLIGGSMVPVAGEMLDIYTIIDPSSSTLDRVLSGGSLAANVLSGGLLPNYGGAVKGARKLCEAAKKGKVHIDIGGEGKYPDAVNLNPGTTTTTTGTPGQPIPNLVVGIGEQAPFKTSIADLVTLENAPIRSGTASEIARIVKPGGEVRLVHPSAYATSTHQQVINAIGGSVSQQTVGGITTTIIRVP